MNLKNIFKKKKEEEDRPEPQVTLEITVKKTTEVPTINTFAHIEMGNRKYQQDTIYVTPSHMLSANRKVRSLGVVCDGMGGTEDGGMASRTAIQTLKTDFEAIEKVSEVNIPKFLYEEIQKLDDMVYNLPSQTGKGSGSTIVAVIIEDRNLYWACAGDSRIYIMRNGQLTQITRDHNHLLQLQEMVARGEMSVEQLELEPQKEALISFLGIGDIELIDVAASPIQLYEKDMVLLCSDGITKTLSDPDILEILSAEQSPLEKKAEDLVMAALRRNTRTQDNTSAIIMEYSKVKVK